MNRNVCFIPIVLIYVLRYHNAAIRHTAYSAFANSGFDLFS
jgi:hypothetical protein